MPGRFIVLEGGEGAGKTTQLRRVATWLRARGRTVRETREPGGTALGEAVRELLKSGTPGSITAEAELLLMFAARSQHLHECILPALEAGEDVLCDRFVDASYAYQGGGRGIASAQIDQLTAWTCGPLQPSLVLLLDIDVRLGMQRARQRGTADRFEQENIAFFERVRAAYGARAQEHPDRIVRIDASGDEATVWRTIETVLEERL